VNGRVRPRVGRLLNDARFSLAPSGGEDVLRQGLIMLAMYAVYDVSRAVVVGREAAAMANGLFFLNLEKAMGIYVEPWVQSHISASPAAMSFMVWAYGALHLPLIMGILVWVFTQRRSQWKLIRNWFLGLNFMALLLYFLLPTAPPRMIFTAGIVDMSYMHGKRPAIYENGLLSNPFAAMPSLHFAYALFIALVVFMLVRQGWLRWGGFLYPALMLVVIVATGNHFIVDAFGSALVVAAAWALAVGLQTGDYPATQTVTVRERDG
jgi:PAP2 superfamily